MCDSLAGLLRDRNAFGESESRLPKSTRRYSRLAAEQPQNIAYRFGHGQVLHNLADLLRERGRGEEGLPLEREAVRLLGGLYRSNVKNPDFRQGVQLRLLDARHDSRRSQGPSCRRQVVAEYLRIEPNGFEESSEAAGILCRCAQLGRDDLAVPVRERESLSRTYADRALDALRVAVRNGFRDAKLLQTDTTYKPLHAARRLPATRPRNRGQDRHARQVPLMAPGYKREQSLR